MEILALIDTLESLATGSKRLPLTGRAMISRGKLLELVDQMRLAVPSGVQEAQEIMERRELIINQSLANANRIKANAESESRTRMEESELVKAARRRSDELIQEAENKGRQLMERLQAEMRTRREGADVYAHEVLTNLEAEVLTTLSSIRRGMASLTPKKEEKVKTAKSKKKQEEAPASA